MSSDSESESEGSTQEAAGDEMEAVSEEQWETERAKANIEDLAPVAVGLGFPPDLLVFYDIVVS